MDAIDRLILSELQVNAKQNTKEIASKVGLTVTPTYERIKKLEASGVIEGYAAVLNKKQLGKRVSAYCQVTLSEHNRELISGFEQEMKSFDAIQECHHVSGNFDFLVKVLVEDIESFHAFINEKLSRIQGISTIHSSFVLNSVKDSRLIHLE